MIIDIIYLLVGRLVASPTRDCLYVGYLEFSLVEGASCDACLTKLKNTLDYCVQSDLLEVLNRSTVVYCRT